jgi:ATP-dependent Clp protease protease subunit
MYNFEIKNKSPDVGEIYIYGEITDEKWSDEQTTPKEILEKINTIKDARNVYLYINSPGGSVYSGITIYNLLCRLNGMLTVIVDGIAASAASVVAMAGKRIMMSTGAMMMIHEARGAAVGSSGDMRDTADILDLCNSTISDIYSKKTLLEKTKILAMMKAETWFDADSAVANRFADAVEPGKKVLASLRGVDMDCNGIVFNTQKYKNFPKSSIPIDYSEYENALDINFLFTKLEERVL